jgi:hypothetical protein
MTMPETITMMTNGQDGGQTAVPATTTGGGLLAKYEEMCRAIAEAKAVDEVKEIHDVAAAMQAAARVAKNKDAEADLVEIRMRAERRLGQMIEEQKKTVGLAKGGGTGANQHRAAGLSENPAANSGNRVNAKPDLPTLASQGIDKSLADRSRKASKGTETEFKARVTHKRTITLRGLRQKRKRKPKQLVEQPWVQQPLPDCPLCEGTGQLPRIVPGMDRDGTPCNCVTQNPRPSMEALRARRGELGAQCRAALGTTDDAPEPLSTPAATTAPGEAQKVFGVFNIQFVEIRKEFAALEKAYDRGDVNSVRTSLRILANLTDNAKKGFSTRVQKAAEQKRVRR